MELSAHAYLIQGDSQNLQPVISFLERHGISSHGNPDVFARTFNAFTIDDARMIREKASLKAVGGAGRIFIVGAPTIAPDAQNALLKTFEDPPEGAKFFLVVQSPETLLGTLRSRMLSLEIPYEQKEMLVDPALFLKAPAQKRLDMLKPLLDKGEDDKRDLAATLSFLSGLERLLGEDVTENALALKHAYRARKYAADRGALLKPLLESIALLLP